MIRFILIVSLLIALFQTPVFGESDKEITIGVIAPITGGMAVIGTAVKNGIELAVERTPEKFKNIKFIFEDSQDSAMRSVSAFQKLRTQNQVKLVIVFGSNGGNSIAPLAERYMIPMLNLGFEITPAIGRNYVIRTLNPAYEYIEALLDHLRSQNVKNFRVIRTELPFLTDMVNTLRDRLDDGSKLIELHTVNPGDMDFRTAILKGRKLQGTTTDQLGLFLLPEQIVSFLSQARQFKWTPQLYGTDLFESAARIGGQRITLDGAVYPDNAASDSFRSFYHARYGNTDQLTFAANAFDVAILLASLETDWSKGGDSIVNGLRRVENQSGVLGDFSYVYHEHTGGYYAYPVVLKMIKGDTGIRVQ